MKPRLETAEVYVPDGRPIDEALARTTHLAVAAHQDDLEIMAFDGILKGYQQDDRWFTGVVVTDGAGSSRDGLYKDYTDEKMRAVRRREQKKAAYVGDYAAAILLDYPSSAVKKAADGRPKDDILDILRATRPEVVFTHNLADKHDTHVSVALRTIEAIRSLPPADRPQRLYGCEVWRDLDWLIDADKVGFDVSAHENLQAALLGVFDSQIAGGKRYDLATQGRRRAHATYFASHETDTVSLLNFGTDLTPLVLDPSIDPAAFIADFIDRFRADVVGRVSRFK
ncbi:MAG TPA: PIG-L family deacetylase [Vicinamibacterales bacterium]|nr:PIG-L family deacetylase [Vicinamibacterales bacterium]